MRCIKAFVLVFFLLVVSANLIPAQNTPLTFKIDVKEFYIDNGMQFLIVERPTAPQVSIRLAIRAGSALEDTGKTGIAHMLEHMMFKGTKNFGTIDLREDEALQGKIETAYQTILTEQQKRQPDQTLIQAKYAEMDTLRRKVQKIYVPQAFSSQVGKNGAVGVNAFTTKDQTQYFMSVPSDMTEQWFSIASEQLFEPSWREFYVEKNVVQREWAFRYINNPGGAAWLDLHAAAYTAHPYKNPTIGWKSDIDNFSTESAKAYHTRYYNPTNAVCVLVGDITVAEARRLAMIYFDRYPAGTRSPAKVTREPVQQGPKKSVRFLKGARTPVVRIGFHGVPMGTEDFYALDAMTMILSHGISARMTQNIVNKGLATKAWAHNPDTRYAGMVFLGGSPNEPEALNTKGLSEEERRKVYLDACDNLESILLAEVDRLKTEPVSPRELQRIKKMNQRDFIDRLRSNEALSGTLATLEVQVGWEYLMSYLENMAQVTAQDIQRVTQKYIHTNNKTSVYILPGGKPDKPPENYTEQRSIGGSGADNVVKPASFENHSLYDTPVGWKHPLSFDRQPKKIEYPEAERFTVGNVPVFFLPDTALPFVDLAIQVKVGSVDVDKSKTGLAGLLNQILIRGGTQTYSPTELALVLDENAIKISVTIKEEYTEIRLSVMKEEWEEGLALLTDILTRPRFDSRVLNVLKQQSIISVKRQGENAQTVAMREAEIWRFKGHPYGRDPLLSIKTIPAISDADLKQFVSLHFVPANMVVAVAGDIEANEVSDGLARFLKSFPTTGPSPRLLEEPKAASPVLVLINKPGQVQSQISLGLPSVKRTHPDFWRISLLMGVFGGNDSLLYRRLRDDLGLVYSTGFFQAYKWKAGMLIGYIGCKSDKTSEAIEETLTIMKSLQKDIPSEQLALKRLDFLNSFVFNVDTPFQLTEVYSLYDLRKEPLNTLDKIQDAYMTASKQELEALAGKYLDPQKIQIFVVADKSTPVKRDGKVITLEKDFMALADRLGIPYQEMALR